MLDSWAEQNVNPALFSRELMANASSFVGDAEVCLFFSSMQIVHCRCNLMQYVTLAALSCLQWSQVSFFVGKNLKGLTNNSSSLSMSLKHYLFVPILKH